jgi:hypothetical protein
MKLIKKCKYCNRVLWFWQGKSYQYHLDCVVPAYNAVKEYYYNITYNPSKKVKPLTLRQYRELERDVKTLEAILLEDWK